MPWAYKCLCPEIVASWLAVVARRPDGMRGTRPVFYGNYATFLTSWIACHSIGPFLGWKTEPPIPVWDTEAWRLEQPS